MENKTYRALVVREETDGSFTKSIEDKTISELPEGDVIIQVAFAGLNYKDALSASGHKGISKNFPHTPGVDAAGTVAHTDSELFKVGEEVIVTGYDLGMDTSGGFQDYIRIPAGWVVKKPTGITLKEAMVYGTAGFTAALSLDKMMRIGQAPSSGPILVTGSTGGVGSMAVGILHAAGFEVIASTGKTDAADHLTSLGATQIVDRSFADDDTGRSLLRSKWAGAIDTVGGNTLATCVKACQRGGSVASCGLVASHELELTVYPFLLNGINILGVDSAETNMNLRTELWKKLGSNWKIPNLESYSTEVVLDQIIPQMELILKGQTKGRVVVAF